MAEPSQPPPGRAGQSDLIRRLGERRARHRQRSWLYRLGVVVLGFLLVGAGIVLSGPGVPGPGFVVIALGLGLLALEFTWAERLLARVVEQAERAKERASRTTRGEKILSGVAATVVLAAVVVVAILYDIPYLPV